MTFRLLFYMQIGFLMASCGSRETNSIDRAIANVYEPYSFEVPFVLNFQLELDSGYAKDIAIGNYEVSGFVDGAKKKQGYWTIYNNTSGVVYKGHFKNDQKTEWWEAYEGNKLLCIGRFTSDKKVGCWKFFNKLVNKRYCLNFVNDTLQGIAMIYSIDSTLLLEGAFEKGIANDYWKIYYASGKLKQQGTCYRGLKNGWWQNYDTLGFISKEASYSQGDVAGYVKEYVAGKISAEGKELNGRKRGTWKQYDLNGNCNRIKEYED